MLKQKKAVSLMVSYVLLIVISITLAILVYYWLLPQINLEEMPKCPDNVALIIMDYSCDSSTDEITLTLKNQGRFNIEGIFIRGTDNPNEEAIPATGLSDPENTAGENGTHYFNFKDQPKKSSLEPNEQYIKIFSYSFGEGKELKKIQIEPFRIQNSTKTGKSGIALCDTATITQKVECVAPTQPPADGGVPPQSLISWWRFEDTTDSEDGNGISLMGGASLDPAGRIGKALKVTESVQYAQINPAPSNLKLEGDLTIEAWINVVDISLGGYIINLMDSGGSISRYKLGIDTSGNLIFYWGGNLVVTSSIPISAGEWYHVVVTKSSDNFKIYINGDEKGSEINSATFSYSSDDILNIGKLKNGFTDETAVYNQALLNTEISQHYTNTQDGAGDYFTS